MLKKLGIIFSLIVLIIAILVQVNFCHAISYTLPFTDNVNRPANINQNTVVTTDSHGMWVVTSGGLFGSSPKTEAAYFYQDGSEITMSFMTSGFNFQVIPMPDPSPILSATMRPANINPGTILILENGQVWKVITGGLFGSSSKLENVIVYQMSVGARYYMSLQTSGVALEVVLLSEPPPQPANWNWLKSANLVDLTNSGYGMLILPMNYNDEFIFYIAAADFEGQDTTAICGIAYYEDPLNYLLRGTLNTSVSKESHFISWRSDGHHLTILTCVYASGYIGNIHMVAGDNAVLKFPTY